MAYGVGINCHSRLFISFTPEVNASHDNLSKHVLKGHVTDPVFVPLFLEWRSQDLDDADDKFSGCSNSFVFLPLPILTTWPTVRVQKAAVAINKFAWYGGETNRTVFNKN